MERAGRDGKQLSQQVPAANLNSTESGYREKAVAQDQWQTWTRASSEKGAGAIHKWAKGTEDPQQTLARQPGGTVTAKPLKCLNA